MVCRSHSDYHNFLCRSWLVKLGVFWLNGSQREYSSKAVGVLGLFRGTYSNKHMCVFCFVNTVKILGVGIFFNCLVGPERGGRPAARTKYMLAYTGITAAVERRWMFRTP